MSFALAKSLFSHNIKARDGHICKRCGNPEREGNIFTKLDCAHFISCSYPNSEFSEDNCTSLCRSCHSYLHAHPKEHEAFFVDLLGEEGAQRVRDLAYGQKVIYKTWYGSRTHLKELRKRLKEFS